MGEPQQKATGLSNLMVEINLNDCQSLAATLRVNYLDEVWNSPRVVPVPSCEMLRGLVCGLWIEGFFAACYSKASSEEAISWLYIGFGM